MTHFNRRSVSRVMLFRFCFVLAFTWVMTERGQAQVLYGTIVGNVNDTSGAGVPGAAVTIIHKETNLSRQTLTNDTGVYNFPNAHTGTYTVRVALRGFKEFVKTDVQVTVNTITRVDAALEVGEI